jgi:hypothetical protein
MSFKPEVKTPGDRDWHGNALRFAHLWEAQTYVHDLAMRWTSVQETRVIEVDDPVNYTWDADYGAKPIVPPHPLSTPDNS